MTGVYRPDYWLCVRGEHRYAVPAHKTTLSTEVGRSVPVEGVEPATVAADDVLAVTDDPRIAALWCQARTYSEVQSLMGTRRFWALKPGATVPDMASQGMLVR